MTEPFSRLCGLENEYVVRAPPGISGLRPTTGAVIDALMTVLRDSFGAVATTESDTRDVFVANGGRFYFEHLHETQGLLEGATPECTSPFELLLYQRAQERILVRAAELSRGRRAVGTLSRTENVAFVRNARDAYGNLYGPQESYEVDVARGAALVAYRLALGLTALVMVGWWAMALALVLTLVPVVLACLLVVGVLALATRPFAKGLVDDLVFAFDALISGPTFLPRVGQAVYVLVAPVVLANALAEWLAHRQAHNALATFLATRAIIAGTGSLDEFGAFQLSERNPSVTKLRSWAWRDMQQDTAQMLEDARGGKHNYRAERALFRTKAVVESALMGACTLQLRSFFAVFRNKQRLEIMASDANRADVAELLKIGTTLLVLDMDEAGALRGLPRAKDPVAAMHAVSADPSLRCRIALSDGSERTALEVQRMYQRRAHQWLGTLPVHHLEATRIVRLWGEVLDALERDPRDLVGTLDWPTKRFLLHSVDASFAEGRAPLAVRRTVDIRYHELGDGYFESFLQRGVARRLVDADAVEQATMTPPASTPAAVRATLLREAKAELLSVSWDRVVLRDPLGGKKKRLVLLRGGANGT